MKLLTQGFEKKQRTQRHQRCPDTNNYCLNTPSRKRCSFQYSDINYQGVVAHRAHSNMTSFAVEIAWRSIVSPALGNQPVPRGPCWHLLASAVLGVRVAHDNCSIRAKE